MGHRPSCCGLYRVIVLLSLFPALAVAAADSGRRHQPSKQPSIRQITHASWYGREFEGRRTANGTVYNPHHLTAAHPTLHLGTKVKVTELRSGRSVVVQITDRGPYTRNRGIDLSYAAARKLGIVNRGVARVRVESLVNDTQPVLTAYNGYTASWLPRAIIE